ncbi:MAG: helix-turn-helix transcriptional regulator [Bacteroidota bacterium]
MNPISIGEHLMKKRLDTRKTQIEIARELGVSANTISNWENNKTQPNVNQLAKIIELLGYDPLKPGEDTLSSRLLAYRRKKGLSQKKIAKILSLDEETVIRIEKGAKAQFRTLEIIEKFLKD